MNTEQRVVTPLIAKEMLKRNINNRNFKQNNIDFLASQMTSGQWLFDGQPLRFSANGSLLDGQHRLAAIIQSGTSQDFLIVTGIASDAFKVMDTGSKRNAADAFFVSGVDYYSDIASAAKFIINTQDGVNPRNIKASITNTDLLDWYENNKGISDFMKIGDKLTKAFSKVLSRSRIAAFMFIFSKTSVTDAEVFMSKLCNGLDLSVNSPIYVLRKKLFEDKMNTAKLPTRDKTALIIKAWNLHRKGKSCKYIAWGKDEKFPTPL